MRAITPGKFRALLIRVRGAIVQGSDLRPPLAIEIKVQGKEISAVSMEKL